VGRKHLGEKKQLGKPLARINKSLVAPQNCFQFSEMQNGLSTYRNMRNVVS